MRGSVSVGQVGGGDDEAARVEEGGEGVSHRGGPGHLDSGLGPKYAGAVTGDTGMEGQGGGEDGGGGGGIGGGIGGGGGGGGGGRTGGGVEFDVGAFIGLKEGLQGFQMSTLEVVGVDGGGERGSIRVAAAGAGASAGAVPVCEVVRLPLKPGKETNKRRVIFGVGWLAQARYPTPSCSGPTYFCFILVAPPLFHHERGRGQCPPSRQQGRISALAASRSLLLLLRLVFLLLSLLLLLLLLLLPQTLGRKEGVRYAAAIGHRDGEDAARVHGSSIYLSNGLVWYSIGRAGWEGECVSHR